MTSADYDTLVQFDFNGVDRIYTGGLGISGIDARRNHGTLSTASFDADLAARLGPGHLHANHAVLFRPDAGTLHGKLFLVVDINGTPGYQSGEDLVIRLDHPKNLGALDPRDFFLVV